MPRTSPSELTISVTTRPQPPCRFTRRRNAVSVMPAIGASANGDARSTEPIFMGQSRATVQSAQYALDVRGIDFDAHGLADQIDRRARAARARPCAPAGRRRPSAGRARLRPSCPSRISGHGSNCRSLSTSRRMPSISTSGNRRDLAVERDDVDDAGALQDRAGARADRSARSSSRETAASRSSSCDPSSGSSG